MGQPTSALRRGRDRGGRGLAFGLGVAVAAAAGWALFNRAGGKQGGTTPGETAPHRGRRCSIRWSAC